MIVLDGNRLIFGRLATHVAKKLLQGEEVHVINAENIVITGDRLGIIERYRQRRRLQHKGTPEHSPVWPRMPNLLVRRMIRGMLPWKSSRGKEAYKRLRVYSSNPKRLANPVTLETAKLAREELPHMTVLELCRQLGM